MKLISWNVNGIRAAVKKGFIDYLESEQPDILCIQESKAHKEQLSSAILQDHGYHTSLHPGSQHTCSLGSGVRWVLWVRGSGAHCLHNAKNFGQPP